jgi:hypothetical protein
MGVLPLPAFQAIGVSAAFIVKSIRSISPGHSGFVRIVRPIRHDSMLTTSGSTARTRGCAVASAFPDFASLDPGYRAVAQGWAHKQAPAQGCYRLPAAMVSCEPGQTEESEKSHETISFALRHFRSGNQGALGQERVQFRVDALRAAALKKLRRRPDGTDNPANSSAIITIRLLSRKPLRW